MLLNTINNLPIKMRSKRAYFWSMFVLIAIAIFIALFDYIDFFERYYGLDSLKFQSTSDYDLYETKMTPVKIVFSSLFFLALTLIFLYSIYAFRHREEMNVSLALVLAVVILVLIIVLRLIVAAVFLGATVF